MDFVTGVTQKETLEISELLAGDLTGETAQSKRSRACHP